MSPHFASHPLGQTRPARWRNQLNLVAQAMHGGLQLADNNAAVNLRLPLHHIIEGEHALLHCLLDAMFAQVKTRCPNARADYWPTAVWRQMIWQPVYMGIAAVHGLDTALPVERMAFKLLADSSLRILASPSSPYATQADCRALAITAASFAPFVDQLLQALIEYEKSQRPQTRGYNTIRTESNIYQEKDSVRIPRISKPNSRGLVADTFIFGLKAFAEARGLDDHWLAKTGRHWCLAAGLTDRKGNPLSFWQPQKACSDFSNRRNSTHTSVPPVLSGNLMRRACCKDFLVSGDTCASCPLNKSTAKGLQTAPFSHSSTAEHFYRPAT